MTIARVPKQKLAPTPKPEIEDDPLKRSCATCGATMRHDKFRFVVPSLLGDTHYLCDLDCYSTFAAEQSDKMPKKPT